MLAEVDLDAADDRAALVAQAREQRAVAAAQVEDAGALGHEVGDEALVRAKQLPRGHRATSPVARRSPLARNGAMSLCCASGSSRKASCP